MESIDHVVAMLIHKNCSDEQGAQAGYQELIAAIKNSTKGSVDLKERSIKIISEIQGDEFNHTMKLCALAREWDGVAPTDDDLAEALSTIGGK